MKFALLALVAASAADVEDAVLDDYVNMMMRQASDDKGLAETDLDEAIQAKHGHGPHGHGPHGHNPHRHWPHRHNPHRHNPHRHTPYPTPFPTPHPCDNGSHGCDKSRGGICYKAGGNRWNCGCRGGYHCTRGCSAPHSYHTCAVITANPTPYPTTFPTTFPTPFPTPYPTGTPTPAPTPAPTTIDMEEVDGIKFCCQKAIAIDSSYILPLHTCADVRAQSRESIRQALHDLELNSGLKNTDVVQWLHNNRCNHNTDFGGTNFPTPVPTPAPTPVPTPAPTAQPTSFNGIHETLLHLKDSHGKFWGKIGLPSGSGKLHVSASNCVDRSNLCGTFGRMKWEARDTTCKVKTFASVVSGVKLVHDTTSPTNINLYDDGTLRFESDNCIQVEQDVSAADLLAADCLTQVNFGDPSNPGGHICMDASGIVTMRARGTLTL